MDEIFSYQENNNSKLIDDFQNGNNEYLRVELDYQSRGFKAPKKQQSYYHRVFETYFLTEKCNNNTFNGNTFYYCKKMKKFYLKYKQYFQELFLKVMI